MKLSYYNIFVDIDKDKNLIYNTLSDSIAIVDVAVKKSLLKNETCHIPDDILSQLEECGIIINDSVNEKHIYALRRDYHRFMEKRTYIVLTVTDSCNCACEYCFESHQNSRGVLSQPINQHIRKFVTSVTLQNDSKVLQIDFIGGEPFVAMKSVVSEMCFYNEWCQKNGVSVFYRFYTNGTILTPEIQKVLHENRDRIKDLQITIDGPQNIHDKFRPLKNSGSSYEAIITNLQILKKSSIPVIIRINFNKHSYQHIPELLDNLIEAGLQDAQIDLYAVQAMTEGCGAFSLAISDKDTINLFPIIWEQCINKGFDIKLRPRTSYLYCSASCFSSYVINFKGDVYKCAILQTNEKYKVGNVSHEGNLVNITDEYYKWMNRNPLEFEKCKNCVLLPICGGGCAGSAEYKYGSYLMGNCFDMNILLIKHRLKLYYETMYNYSVQ